MNGRTRACEAGGGSRETRVDSTGSSAEEIARRWWRPRCGEDERGRDNRRMHRQARVRGEYVRCVVCMGCRQERRCGSAAVCRVSEWWVWGDTDQRLCDAAATGWWTMVTRIGGGDGGGGDCGGDVCVRRWPGGWQWTCATEAYGPAGECSPRAALWHLLSPSKRA